MDGVVWKIESMSMRILHVITSLRTGGAEHLLVDLLPRLRNMGHEVELLLFDGTRTAYYIELEEREIKIYALACGASAMHNPLLVWKLRTFLNIHQYDIVHTHNTPCQFLVAMASRGVTLVTTEHCTTNRRRGWWWYKGVDRWMYGKYSHVVCVSKVVEKNLRQQLSREDITTISTIANGIELSRFATARPNRELREQHEGKHIIMMVAAFRQEKDQATLIRAMAELSDEYVLLLVGDGECRKDCEHLAQRLNVEHKINFLGFRADAPSLLATADVVVMSSHHEGFCLAVVEGMAAGRPVVATDVEVLDSMVGNVGLLFPHRDHKTLARVVRQLCEDQKFYDNVVERCRQHATHFDIDCMAKEYEQIYKQYYDYEIN